MTDVPVLVLLGPPGADVVPVAEAVAARLGVDSADTDALVAVRLGASVADVFVEQGEDAFRAHEREAVRRALTARAVVALGGGAVQDEATRADLAALAHEGVPVVLLEVSMAQAVPRLGFNAPRPAGLGNPRQLWSELMDLRRPLYRAVATHVVGTDGLSPEQVADEVLAQTGLDRSGQRG